MHNRKLTHDANSRSRCEFPEVPANNYSLAGRKPVCGVGINDAPYLTQPTIDGKVCQDPIYALWRTMLNRIYKLQPDLGLSVTEEWLSFMGFRAWVLGQDIKDKEFILLPQAKVYSPENCVFADYYVARALQGQSGRGDLPLGVSLDRNTGGYQVRLQRYGKNRNLGQYDTVAMARLVYNRAKRDYLNELAEATSDPRVREALLLKAAEARNKRN